MDIPFIDIHTHCYGEYGYTFGIHPWWFDNAEYRPDSDLSALEQLLKENRLAAIGEVGIDKVHKATLSAQIEIFERQILLSEKYRKPMIIHNVKGTDIILRLHKKHQPQQAWIIHGFNGTAQEAKMLTDKGLFLSVGENLMYHNRKITQSLSSIPLDHLFFETDTAEIEIKVIYEKAAEGLNLPLEVLKERIFANFARLNLTKWKTGETEHGCSSETMALRNCDRAMCWW